MIPRFQVLSQRIAVELAQVARAADKARQAFESGKHGGRDETFFYDSTALNLHGFYNGVERIFEAIAHDIDQAPPGGAAWHRDLLAQMEWELPGVRPRVIRAETRAALEEYLRFRHLVRNLYTWDFIPNKLEELTSHLAQTVMDLQTDLESFRQFLASASRADETDGD